MQRLGERQIVLDCDALQADGGTRTASICGAFVALHDACTRLVMDGTLGRHPITDYCAAISVGMLEGEARLDLPYVEDSVAEVDMNVVMLGNGDFVEVQGTAEGATFGRDMLNALLDLADGGIRTIVAAQNEVVATAPGPRPDRG